MSVELTCTIPRVYYQEKQCRQVTIPERADIGLEQAFIGGVHLLEPDRDEERQQKERRTRLGTKF
jgi:hypothetical protein